MIRPLETVGDKTNFLLFASKIFDKPSLNPFYKKQDEHTSCDSEEIVITPWIEEWISEIKEKIMNNNDNPFSIEIASNIVNLFGDLNETIYLKIEQPSLSSLLDQKSAYIEKIIEAVKRASNKTTEIINNKLSLNYLDVYQSFATQVDAEKTKDILSQYRKPYSLPVISKSLVKEAFMLYSISLFEIMNNSQSLNTNDFASIESFFLCEERYLSDKIYVKYGIHIRLMRSLVEYHNLLLDEEVGILWDQVGVLMP